MKERPILFSTEMVRALLDNRKTVTRRVVKLHPTRAEKVIQLTHPSDKGYFNFVSPDGWAHSLQCPYGVVGDRLWVRETWSWGIRFDEHGNKTEPIVYRADANPDTVSVFDGSWNPSIHMPRAASRITLEITNVRVERLQEITIADCKKEGFSTVPMLNEAFVDLAKHWDLLNAKRGYSWGINPWVWVIEFKNMKISND